MKLIFKLLLREMHGSYCRECPFLDIYTDDDHDVIYMCTVLKKSFIWPEHILAACKEDKRFGKKL